MTIEQSLTAEIETEVSTSEVATDGIEAEVVETEKGEPEVAETEGVEELHEATETEKAEESEETAEDVKDAEPVEPVEPIEPVEPVEPVKPIARAQSQFSDETLTRAVKAGIGLADAREFGSEVALLRVVDGMETKEASDTKSDLLDSFPKLNPEQYDEDVIKTFDTLKDVVREQRDQIELLMNGNTQREQASQYEASQELGQWFDGSVKELGEGFTETLGKGGHASLAPGSSQLAKREAIADQIGILMAGYQAAGREAPSRDELFGTAARSILGDEFQAIRDRKTTAELQSRKKQHIARPGSVNLKQERPVDEEVAAYLDEKYPS